jgi:hypothetical protein
MIQLFYTFARDVSVRAVRVHVQTPQGDPSNFLEVSFRTLILSQRNHIFHLNSSRAHTKYVGIANFYSTSHVGRENHLGVLSCCLHAPVSKSAIMLCQHIQDHLWDYNF